MSLSDKDQYCPTCWREQHPDLPEPDKFLVFCVDHLYAEWVDNRLAQADTVRKQRQEQDL